MHFVIQFFIFFDISIEKILNPKQFPRCSFRGYIKRLYNIKQFFYLYDFVCFFLSYNTTEPLCCKIYFYIIFLHVSANSFYYGFIRSIKTYNKRIDATKSENFFWNIHYCYFSFHKHLSRRELIERHRSIETNERRRYNNWDKTRFGAYGK